MNAIGKICVRAACLFAFALGGCTSLEQISIDYMLPAEVSFPAQLKRVAVVNNMPANPAPMLKGKDPAPINERSRYRHTDYYAGDAKAVAEALAQTIASGNYFDEVVICDSALQAAGSTQAALSQQSVRQLTGDLNVDFLLAVENVQIRAVTDVSPDPYFGLYAGVVDVSVATVVQVYIPQKPARGRVSRTDSIHWNSYEGSLALAREQLVKKNELIAQASDYSGTSIARSILPYWETSNRLYFSGGSVQMRDAAVYVKEENWGEAIRLWQEAYQSKKESQRFTAAFNLALGCEMTDDIEAAIRWIKEAEQLAAKLEKANSSTAYRRTITADYLKQLEKRYQSLPQVIIQMQRFQEDNS